MTTFNMYVSQRSQIIFEDEDHAINIRFRCVKTTLFSLRTTTCDVLFVSSEVCVTDRFWYTRTTMNDSGFNRESYYEKNRRCWKQIRNATVGVIRKYVTRAKGKKLKPFL